MTLSTSLSELINTEANLLSMPKGAFPMQLWQRLAQEKLLLPRLDGQQKTTHLAIAQAAQTLTRLTASPGLGMSWVMQQALVDILSTSNNKVIQQQYLPNLLSGHGLCALSVSEPNAGAHPKRLSAHAEYRDGQYWLNGEKTYISNGPVADIFIVLAITDIIDGRKQFSAFIVPKDAKGLSILPMKSFDALKPTSHCGLKLDNCQIPADHMLGQKGDAFDSISKPFREHEDILMLSTLAGSMQALLDQLIDADQSLVPAQEMGLLLSLIDSVTVLARQAAQQLDETNSPFEPISFIIIVRLLIEQFINTVKTAILHNSVSTTITTLIKDIEVLINIAKTANTAKQKGLALRYLASQVARE